MIETITVDLGPRSYDIIVGTDVLAAAGSRLARLLPGRPLIVISDSTVAELHLSTLLSSLAAAGIAEATPVILPPGESTKDFAHLELLLETLLERGIDRRTVLVALGGGVIGDIVGFAAAIALRGIDFVQVPTTLLAQVDSAVGGKTAIDSRHGKNLIGAFHQPLLVLTDIATLDTLPIRQRRAGYAEVAKYGLLGDADFFSWLEAEGPALCADAPAAPAARDAARAARHRAIVQSCRMKAAIVAADERESGDRALLNLGHTFGHALEAEAGFGDVLLHGEGVALGMVLAFELSADLGLCAAGDVERVRRHLAAIGLPTRIADLPVARDWTPDGLIRPMAKDKKAYDRQPRFVLTRGIGRAFMMHDVPIDAVRAVLARSLAR